MGPCNYAQGQAGPTGATLFCPTSLGGQGVGASPYKGGPPAPVAPDHDRDLKPVNVRPSADACTAVGGAREA